MKSKMKSKAILGNAHLGNAERLARPIKKVEQNGNMVSPKFKAF